MVLLPEEAEMTLSELRQMAARQQHQIEAQQQLLVAKEQRLKFLKQQEARHHNLAEQQLDASCLQNLRDKVETQELKLRQLRALRGQVEQQKTNNGNLGTELDSIRALFSEKEKELNLAVSKVEELTRQLDEIRNNNNNKNCIMSSTSTELENLRMELIYRTKLTEQQNNYICQQQENIALRQQDISLLDKKISELTRRLQRKRLLNEQLASQIHNASLSRNSNSSIANNGLYYAATIVSVEPVQRDIQEPEHTQDDLAANLLHKGYLEEFSLTKNDPKYQTLPYNTKFTLKGKNNEDSLSSSADDESPAIDNSSSQQQNVPPLSVVKPSLTMSNFTARPFSNASNAVSSSPVTKVFPQPNQNKANDDSVSGVNKDIILEDNSNKPEKPLERNESSDELPLSTYKNDQQNSSISKGGLLSTQNAIELKNKVEIQRSNKVSKPVVPPKPTLPIKPMPPVRHTPAKEKTTDDKSDILNMALSVLQNKSSDKDKNAFSNYRERLLYYRCVPRYPRREPVSEVPKTGNKIATYFPKSSAAQSELSIQNNSKQNESNEMLEAPKRKPSFGQLPIRPKPLTIRKTPGLEPPKLKIQQNVNTGINRKTSDSNLLAAHLKTSISPSFLMQPVENKNVNQSQELPAEEKVPEEAVLSITDDKVSIQTENGDCIDNTSQEMPTEVLVPEPVNDNKALEKEESDENDEETTDSSELEIFLPKSESPKETVDLGKEAQVFHSAALRRVKKGNLKSEGSMRSPRRVSFDPLALLLDAALEGELELVKKTASEVPNPSAANDEGITALHNAICAGHVDVVTFLVEFGCDVNAQDSDGWTPLHCAASCNNLPMVKFLVERGACIFATTLSDQETAAEKCEEEEEGFDGCSEYLYSLQENLGVMNNGVVYAVYDYEVQNADELSFKDGDCLTVLRKGDDEENEWWWSRLFDEEGYVPRNLLGLYPRVTCQKE